MVQGAFCEEQSNFWGNWIMDWVLTQSLGSSPAFYCPSLTNKINPICSYDHITLVESVSMVRKPGVLGETFPKLLSPGWCQLQSQQHWSIHCSLTPDSIGEAKLKLHLFWLQNKYALNVSWKSQCGRQNPPSIWKILEDLQLFLIFI